MTEKCRNTAVTIENLGVLNYQTISDALSTAELGETSRIIVTDRSGMTVYDSAIDHEPTAHFALLPEIVQALKGNDIFTWNYKNSQMQSRTAIPVYSFGQLTGCVYMMEYDNEQGLLIYSLQSNIFTITALLEIAVVIFSFLFSTLYSGRLKKIMSSIRTVRAGDYSHKVDMNGHDELTELSDEFNDLISRLQRSENQRRQFVSDASHELKTPLASIKLLSDSILQNEMDEQTVREFVGDIGNEAERLNRMSQKLLNLAQTDDQTEVDFEIQYILPTIEKVVRMLSGHADDQHVTIHIQAETDSTILIQPDDLYQIIFNLVENGIKYNKRGGQLRICLQRDGDNAIISVSDTGQGIPEESIEHVFERFYRVDKARSRSTGGSGLGLSIVKNMVERNRGTIQLESQQGIGSTFIISFPVFDMEDHRDEN